MNKEDREHECLIWMDHAYLIECMVTTRIGEFQKKLKAGDTDAANRLLEAHVEILKLDYCLDRALQVFIGNIDPDTSHKDWEKVQRGEMIPIEIAKYVPAPDGRRPLGTDKEIEE